MNISMCYICKVVRAS